MRIRGKQVPGCRFAYPGYAGCDHTAAVANAKDGGRPGGSAKAQTADKNPFIGDAL